MKLGDMINLLAISEVHNNLCYWLITCIVGWNASREGPVARILVGS